MAHNSAGLPQQARVCVRARVRASHVEERFAEVRRGEGDGQQAAVRRQHAVRLRQHRGHARADLRQRVPRVLVVHHKAVDGALFDDDVEAGCVEGQRQHVCDGPRDGAAAACARALPHLGHHRRRSVRGADVLQPRQAIHVCARCACSVSARVRVRTGGGPGGRPFCACTMQRAPLAPSDMEELPQPSTRMRSSGLHSRSTSARKCS